MAVYVALIRAIGPVTHAKMKMAALRDACEDAGLADVATVGNTGNIVFRSDKGVAAVRKLVQGVVDGFGLGPANEVFVRTLEEMAAVVAANPFPEVAAERPAELGVASFHEAPDWKLIISGYDGPEQIATIGSHLIVAYPKGISTSKLNIEKLLGARMTQRNWRVFAALAQKAAELQG
jgi:uncharacterized protein (DUF1697 family)